MIGLYGIATKKNIVKITIGLAIMEYGINLLLILIGYRRGGVAPIREAGMAADKFMDPLPQAMVVTCIVISLSMLILMVALCIRLYERYGTFDITKMRRLNG